MQTACWFSCVVLLWGVTPSTLSAPNTKGQLVKDGRQGKQGNQPRVGCPPGCVCGQSGGDEMSKFTVNCEQFPKTALPPEFKTFQAKSSPKNLTRETLIPLRPSSITTVDLCSSGIEDIVDGALPVFPRLTILKLSFNHLKQIKVNTFIGCNLLREVYLDGNELTTLGAGCFSRIPNLQVLHLHHNQLQQLPSLPPSLNALDISYNHISDVGNFSFQDKIKNVDLCSNPLKEVPAACFAKALKLKSLCIPNLPPIPVPSVQRTKNGQPDIQPFSEVQNLTLSAPNLGMDLPSQVMKDIEQMTNILYLSIIGYNIHTLHFIREHHLLKLKLSHVSLTGPNLQARKDFLMSLASQEILQNLDLSKSPQLAAIVVDDEDIWRHFQNIHYVNFHDCRLTSIGQVQGSTSGNPAARKPMFADLSMNPLHCDCAFASKLLKDDIRLVGDLGATLCSAPDTLRGQPLLHVIKECDTGVNETSESGAQHPPLSTVPQPSKGVENAFDTPALPNGSGVPSSEDLASDLGKNREEQEDKYDSNVKFPEERPAQPEPDFSPEVGVNEEEVVLKGNSGFPNPNENDGGGSNLSNEHHKGEESHINENLNEEPHNNEEEHHAKEEPEFTDEEIPEEHVPSEDYTFLDGESSHFADKEREKTTYIIVGVILVLAALGAILFSVLFFYFRRRGHAGIEGGNALFRKQASSKDNLVKSHK